MQSGHSPGEDLGLAELPLSSKERVNVGEMVSRAEKGSRKGEEVMLEGKELSLHLSLQKEGGREGAGRDWSGFTLELLWAWSSFYKPWSILCVHKPLLQAATLGNCLLCLCYSRAAMAISHHPCQEMQLSVISRQYCSVLALIKITLQYSFPISNSCAPKIVFLT